MLADLEIDWNDLRFIKSIYWIQHSAHKIDYQVGQYRLIKRGIQQGCVLSLILFRRYNENIMRYFARYEGKHD